MNVAQIENNLQLLVKSFDEQSFIYDLMLAYGQPKASIKRLKDGGLNLSKNNGEILWKKKLFFKESKDTDLHDLIDDLRVNESISKHTPRFIIVTDYKNLLALDTKTNDTLDIEILEIPLHFDFFLPLAGMEKAQHQFENPADVKAAERMGKLYDEIKKDNPTDTEEQIHNLNVFLTRLLFCFFSEDTNIFEKSQFTHSLVNHTQNDGSDLHTHFERLFQVMNTPENERGNIPVFLNSFPYVNGGLFRNQHNIPRFSRKSRQVIIESGELDWSAINPDIFGSMIQAVITPEHRGGLGMHYTSVPNIMKVIEPLFLNDFYEEFDSSKGNPKKLLQLLNRLWNTKYFDPACGSGNFLIITYKELRKLEMKIFKDLNEMALSNITLNQFYGIELDDFAHEVAILSLWLAEHQMNQVFFNEFGRSKPALPLTSAGNIVHGNATRIDWEVVCPKANNYETFILGNPPYLGFNERSKDQKSDMDIALIDSGNIQRLDYISCWFVKATNYISNSISKYAFVSTNSICQGEQVSLLWPHIFSKKQEIFFAFQPFKWTNNAKGNAGVTCVILGIQNSNSNERYIYSEGIRKSVKSISPYLIEGNPIIMSQRKTPISKLPEMILGSSGIDGGHLILTSEDKQLFVSENPKSEKFIKPFIGGGDFIDGTERFCLWIDDRLIKEANEINLIKDRIEKCYNYRLTAGRDAKKAASVPHRFFYRKHQEKDAIILPMTSSERRQFLPVGFMTNRAIVSNGVFVIYDSEPFIMGLLSSRLHMLWTQAVSGKLESRIRYSVNLAYNCFPFPNITESQKKELNIYVYKILEEREFNSEKTLSQLYDPDKMPAGLREAHQLLDRKIESYYRSKPFDNDEERLEYLFKLYEQMIEEEKSNGTLFEMESKPKKKKK
jgi:hypothetical protein